MPTQDGLTSQMQTIDTGRPHGATYPATAARAWEVRICPHCGAAQMLVIAIAVEQQNSSTPELVERGPRWYLCSSCRQPSVLVDGVIQPSSRPLRTPKGLPTTDRAIWEEARSCLGVHAYSATVMLCRKLLLHVAVEKGLPPKNKQNRAPSYMDAVRHLESSGVITADMREWVDQIKSIGNDANHELTPIAESQANDVATFTEQLLILAYEMRALRAGPVSQVPDEDQLDDPDAGN